MTQHVLFFFSSICYYYTKNDTINDLTEAPYSSKSIMPQYSKFKWGVITFDNFQTKTQAFQTPEP